MPSEPVSARTPSAPLGKASRQSRRGGGKKKRAVRRMRAAYVVAAVSVLFVAGATAWLSAYVFDRWFPPSVKTGSVGEATRLSVPMTYESQLPSRKGLVVMAPDQIYRETATDLTTITRRESVQRLCTRGVVTVFGDGAFHGQEPVTRAEYVTWLYNAWLAQTERGADPFVPVKNAPPKRRADENPFDDLTPEHWAFEVWATFQGNHLLTGRQCRPDAVLRRQEWATLSRAVMEPPGERAGAKAPDARQLKDVMRRLHFNDAQAIAPEHAPAIFWLFGQERLATAVTQTFEMPAKAGPWKPQLPVTRLEAAVWIDEVFDEIGRVF